MFISEARDMNLIDYFAAQAMQAMISNGKEFENLTTEELADRAYEHAEAMMIARIAWIKRNNVY